MWGICLMKLNHLPVPPKLRNKMRDYPSFYQKVWYACIQIPKGEVRTYGWVAKKIGKPGSARAVGTALGKNPFSPQIPCHRVVRADGQVGGYSGRGGLLRKRHLLKKEGALK
jgi:O-6-methylguanine DNA methyltransferase